MKDTEKKELAKGGEKHIRVRERVTGHCRQNGILKFKL